MEKFKQIFLAKIIWSFQVLFLRTVKEQRTSLVAQMVKKSACNAGDPGSFSGLGISPGGGNGNPLQYSCSENSMDRGAWQLQSMGSQRAGQDWVTNTRGTEVIFNLDWLTSRCLDKTCLCTLLSSLWTRKFSSLPSGNRHYSQPCVSSGTATATLNLLGGSFPRVGFFLQWITH